MLLNGTACWVLLDASRPCLCHFGPYAVSRGLSSNQVRFKNLKNPNVHHKDLSSQSVLHSKKAELVARILGNSFRKLDARRRTNICHYQL